MIQQAIKQNQFSVVKEHITKHQEPNLLHQAIFHQKEKIILLLIHEGWDVNAIEKGWTPITLAVWTKNFTVTQILLSQQNVDVNFISPQGTALHIAARNDDEKIVNLLLKHPNIRFNLKFQQKYALDIAGKRTADLIRNEIESRSNIETFRTSVTQYIFLSQNNTLLINMPPKPPLVKGFVNKVHRIFKLRQYERFMIIDPESGFLARYKQAKDEPMNPCELISLLNIKSVKLTNNHWWENGQQYFKIKYGKRKLFFSNYYKQTSEKWVDYIKKSIIYYRYVNNKLQDYWENLDNYKIEQAIADICRRENIIIELKDDSLIDPNVQIKQKVVQIQNQTKKQSFERISEQSQFEEGEQAEIGLKDLKIQECIGKGSFGYVFKVEYQNKFYALKQQSKQQLKQSGNLKYATAEAHILNKCYNPFLMNCISAFQTQQNLYLLMDLCVNGDLAQYMTRGTIWDEYTAKYYIAEVLIGIEYLHSKNIIYRDLKPENVAIGDDGHIKILDFGLSKEGMYENVLTSTFCGSPAYLPPEVLLNQGTNKKSDIYGIGTLLFEMLTGYPPHYSNNIDKLINNIKTQKPELPKNISEPCRLVLKDTLLKPRDERPSARNLKKYEFFSGIEFSKLETKQIKLPPIKKVHPVSRKLQAIVFQDDDQQSDHDFIKGWNFIR